MVWGCLRGVNWHLIGGEQSSRGWGKVGGDGRGNPLPKGQGGVDGGVVGVGRERPLPLPLHNITPPSLGIKLLKAWPLPHAGLTSCLVTPLLLLILNIWGPTCSHSPNPLIFKIDHGIQ